MQNVHTTLPFTKSKITIFCGLTKCCKKKEYHSLGYRITPNRSRLHSKYQIKYLGQRSCVIPKRYDMESRDSHRKTVSNRSPKASLENLQSDMRTGFGIGKRMVMIFQQKSARGRDCVQLMIGKLFAKNAPRCTAGTVELIFGPRHTELIETSPETTLIER